VQAHIQNLHFLESSDLFFPEIDFNHFYGKVCILMEVGFVEMKLLMPTHPPITMLVAPSYELQLQS
jgi:hypothetical protein